MLMDEGREATFFRLDRIPAGNEEVDAETRHDVDAVLVVCV